MKSQPLSTKNAIRRHDINLDMVRGIAALLVLIGHLRAFLFTNMGPIDWGDLPKLGFYFITGLGQPAVMIFFVLSGFLIARSSEARLQAGQWNIGDYWVQRLSRLWMVLIPALLLTAFWDSLGRAGGDTLYYLGELQSHYVSGPFAMDLPEAYSVATFLQNLFFLQTITTSNFGTNMPLWSLAQEFWYYLLFALFVALRAGHVNRMLTITLLVIVLLWLPGILLFGGLVWLIGYAAVWLDRMAQSYPLIGSRRFMWASLSLLFVVLCLIRATALPPRLGDILLGLSFALAIPGLLRHTPGSTLYAAASRYLSNISYTLYLVHFPLLGFICSQTLDNQQFGFDAGSLVWIWFLGLLALCLLYATTIWFVFEKNTAWLRTHMSRLFRNNHP